MYAPDFTVHHIRYMRRILKDNARIIRIIGHFRRMKSDIFRLPLPRTRYIPGPSDRTVFKFEKIYREVHKVR